MTIGFHKLIIKGFFGKANSQNSHRNLKKKRRENFGLFDTKLKLKPRNVRNVVMVQKQTNGSGTEKEDPVTGLLIHGIRYTTQGALQINGGRIDYSKKRYSPSRKNKVRSLSNIQK